MTFSPGTAASVVAAKLELTLSCRGLHDADVFSLSDPMVVVEEMVRLFLVLFGDALSVSRYLAHEIGTS